MLSGRGQCWLAKNPEDSRLRQWVGLRSGQRREAREAKMLGPLSGEQGRLRFMGTGAEKVWAKCQGGWIGSTSAGFFLCF